jgi:hypothetical protein
MLESVEAVIRDIVSGLWFAIRSTFQGIGTPLKSIGIGSWRGTQRR